MRKSCGGSRSEISGGIKDIRSEISGITGTSLQKKVDINIIIIKNIIIIIIILIIIIIIIMMMMR